MAKKNIPTTNTRNGRRGGRRPGAGRPKHSGSYREPTTPVRIPQSLLPVVQNLLKQTAAQRQAGASADCPSVQSIMQPLVRVPFTLPLYTSRVAAGSPATADDHVDETVDINTLLVKRPDSTYCVRVSGDSMIDAGIFAGDVLIVEKRSEARHGQIVIAAVNGEFTVKRYSCQGNRVRLLAENASYKPIDITPTVRFQLWGVVIGLVRQSL